MNKRATILIFGASLLLMSACRSFIGQSESINNRSLSEINAVIEAYENEGITPSNSNMAVYYAERAHCYAHHLPKYGATRFFLYETFSPDPDCACGSTVTGILALPVALTFDTVNYPIQYFRTLAVSESDINQALLDLKKARALTDDQHEIDMLRGAFILNIPLDKAGLPTNKSE